MPNHHQPYFWKKMPFVRLIIPFGAGILIQWYFDFSSFPLLAIAGFATLAIFIFFRLPFAVMYTYRWLPGISINFLLIVIGAFITYNKDIRKKPGWIGHYSRDSLAVLATLQEPLVEKAKTYKAEAAVEAVNKGEWKNATGNVLIYFSKDSSIPTLQYGSQVLLYKPLQQIKNSGNPGSFNYKQYNAL